MTKYRQEITKQFQPYPPIHRPASYAKPRQQNEQKHKGTPSYLS
jgi:hypothetical protein